MAKQADEFAAATGSKASTTEEWRVLATWNLDACLQDI